MAKMSSKMIVLCAAAIGTIYTAGFVVTEAPGTAYGANPPSVATAPSQYKFDNTNQQQPWVLPGNSSNSGTASAGSVSSAQSSSVANQSQYKDGVYYGQGSNRIGSIQVAVTIKQGKISACDIVRCTTHYRQSYIDPVLPQQVLDRQSSEVDLVSGATRSSEDFIVAVQQALSQAQS